MNRGVVLLAVVGADICRAALTAPGDTPTRDSFAPCTSQGQLTAFLKSVLADAGDPQLVGAAIAATGPQDDDNVIVAGEADWALDRRVLRRTLDTPHVRLVQGVVACALAAPRLSGARLRPLHAAPISRDAPLAAILPEAALGVAFLYPDPRGEGLAVLSHAGCINLSAANRREAAVMGRLGAGPILAQDVLSREGLERIHQAVRVLAGGPEVLLDASVVIQRAREGDAAAVEAIRLYSAWLGGFAGDIALIARARGGVYINSHFLRRMADLLDIEAFRGRYLEKSRTVARKPVFLVSGPTALDGLATLFTPSDARFGQQDIHLLDC